MNKSWGAACRALEGELGADAYKNWIAPLDLAGCEAGIVRLVAPTSFMGMWVERNYGGRILALLRQAGFDATRLVFDIAPQGATTLHAQQTQHKKMDGKGAETADQEPHARGALPMAGNAFGKASAAQKDLETAALDKRLTFENFVVGAPNELAYASAKRVVHGQSVSFNPLFFYGGVGLGKTHLMQAIAWGIRAQRPEAHVVYLTAEQFMYRFVQALRARKIIDFKDLFRSVDVLMIDDVQFIAGKDSTQDEFFHTFNALIDQGKQIVVAAHQAPSAIEGIDERLLSRLQGGLVVDLHPTSYDLRLEILKRKYAMFQKDHSTVRLAPGVLEFLAERVQSNVRVVEGALNRLIAFAGLIGREVSVEITEQVLSDLLRSTERRLTVDEILRKVAEHFNVSLAEMMGPRRARMIARPRQIAMYLAKELTSKSLPDIGRRCGNRDHTTVLHAVKRITELQKTDTQLCEDLAHLRRRLAG